MNNDIKDVVELVKYRSEQQEKMQQIDDRQQEIYKENSSRKRRIKTDEQYREYQMWHVGVQEELDELKLEKREVKKQLQLVEGIMKEDLYTAYYAVSENEAIVSDRDIEIPRMCQSVAVAEIEKKTGNDIEHVDTKIYRNEAVSVADEYSNIEKEQADLYDVEHWETDKIASEQIYAGESETVDDVVAVTSEVPDKAQWIVDRLSAYGVYEDIDVAVKADIFGFDIADVSGSIRLFSDVMKKMGIKLAGNELYEELQRIYDESVSRDVDKEKVEDKMWNRGRGR